MRRINPVFAVSLLAFASFAALFFFRSADDNRLTSWLWVFREVDPSWAYLALVAALFTAYAVSRLPRPGPLALFFIAFALSAVFWRVPEVIIDSSRYFTQAKHLELYGVGYFMKEWGGRIEAWTDLPAVPFIYGLAFKFLGESRLCVQVLTSAMFSLTVALTALIGRDLWDDETGSYAGAFMLGMPYLYSQVPLMLVDVPSMFFLVLAIFAFRRTLRRGGLLMGGLAAGAIVLCVFSKYSLWLMLSEIAVLFAVCLRGAPKGKTVLRGALVALAAAAVSGIFYLHWRDVMDAQLRLLVEYQRPGLGRWTESFASTFLFQVHPFITAAALFSVYLAIRRRDPQHIVAAWLLVLIAVFQIKRIRYTVPAFPMLALAGAYGLGALKEEATRKFVAAVAASTSVAVAVFFYIPFLDGFSAVNLKDAGAYLDGLEAKESRVYALPGDSEANPAVSVPLLDIFTRKRLLYDYEAPEMPPGEGFETSPLRFTWRYKNPAYYAGRGGGAGGEEVVAIISDRRPDTPESYSVARIFDKHEGIFRLRTFVTVYRRTENPAQMEQ